MPGDDLRPQRLPISTGLLCIRMRIARIPDKGSKGHSRRTPFHRNETNSGLPKWAGMCCGTTKPVIVVVVRRVVVVPVRPAEVVWIVIVPGTAAEDAMLEP